MTCAAGLCGQGKRAQTRTNCRHYRARWFALTEVHRLILNGSIIFTRTPRVKDQNLILRYGDLSDPSNLVSLISAIQPDEVST